MYPQTLSRCLLSAAGVTTLAAASWLCAASRDAAPVPDRPAKAADAGQVAFKYQGTGDCNRCHEKPTERDKKNHITDYFDLTELATWEEKDKHAVAYKVLKNSRSKQMGQLLGIKPESDPACVSCHAVNVNASQCAEGNVLAIEQEGVSCEACHGPASNWVDSHWHPNKWREKLTRQEKVEQGMVDLRDAVKRAEICLSCHVGNAEEGKVVTHEMFAAGHPPISGFEIETFLAAMPPHWQPAGKQPPEIRKQYADQRDPDKPEAMYSTRMMTIGGLVALRNYAGLIKDNAEARRKPREGAAATSLPAGTPPNTTELAFYDCQACHHELTVDSWRQKRGYPGRPGRPAVRAWPMALGKLAATACGEQQGPLEEALKKFYQAIDRQPFGAPSELAAASQELIARTGEAIGYLKTQRFDQAKGRAILKAICAAGASELPDFETARQLGWTAKIVYDELPKKGPKAQIDTVLADMRKELALALPTRADEETPEKMAGKADKAQPESAAQPDGAGAGGECVCVANKSVPQTLAAAARYDPLEFQKHCKKLAELLDSAAKEASR